MKQLRKNIRVIAFAIIGAFLFMSVWFVTTVYTNGPRWVNTAYNQRLSVARTTTVQGAVTDRDGVVLSASAQVGERTYHENKSVRRSLSQVVGDQWGMSSTGVENFHASTLLGLTESGAELTLQLLTGEIPKGNDIHLTIDSELNTYVSGLFPEDEGGNELKGAVVITNYRTGEILACVSKPDYDPANKDAEVQDSAYINRALQGQYAPGSTFKIITLMAALDTLPGIEEEEFSCTGLWDYESGQMTCAGGAVHGTLTLKSAFAKSCNITFGKLAYRVGAEKLRAAAEQLGFNANFNFSDIKLYSSSIAGNIAGVGEIAQTGIGQGRTLVTPLHMAMIAGAIANQGVMMTPLLIRQITGPTGIVKSNLSSVPYRTVMNAAMAEKIAKYMYEVVRSGTGTRAQIDGYSDGYVCGKTGTAEVSDDKTAATNAWYVGFLYGDETHPYAISVVLEKGGSGGKNAAALAAKALKKALNCID